MKRATCSMPPCRGILALVAAMGVTLTLGCDNVIPPITQPTPPGSPTAAPAPTPIPAPPPTAPEPPPSKTPTHILTIVASSSCSALPAEATKRSYTVYVREKSDGDIIVWVVGMYDVMVGWGNEPGFTGKRDGATVRFDITDDMFGSNYAMIERIPGVGDMGYIGTATGTIDNGKIVATFDGKFQIGYGSPPAACQASDHRVEFVPTGR